MSGLCLSNLHFHTFLISHPLSQTISPDLIMSHRTGGNGRDSSEAIAENAMRIATTGVGELDVPTMKKYIQYCKAKCSPRLSEEAGDVLASSYVKIRDDVRKRSLEVRNLPRIL
jgi:DNA replicative helicase MCM subunit Mcm2 (Cdc46/Mcm family)